MYLLQFLETCSGQSAGAVDVEYRLACSGELYNRRVQTFDWRKSDATRVLLKAPFELFVVSRPFANYPQELCARMTLNFVTEQGIGNVPVTSILLPDEDVIEDICSILSLLSRRLISPVGKTRERQKLPDLGPHTLDFLGSYGLDLPVPILPQPPVAVWSRRPLTVVTSMDGQQVVDHSPPAVGVDPEMLSEFLLKLPTSQGRSKL
jgi:hypothetical protein